MGERSSNLETHSSSKEGEQIWERDLATSEIHLHKKANKYGREI